LYFWGVLTGGCLCGGVRYEVDESDLGRAGYCHCTRCQRRTGTAASANVSAERGAVRLTAGEELLRTWQPEQGFAKVFCGECGSALFSHPPGEPEARSIRLGTFDGDPGVRPEWRQYLAYAAPWEPVPDDGLAHFPERRS
jgi:hypothetical protein